MDLLAHLSRATCAHELPPPAETPPAEVMLIPAGEVRTRPHDGREAWRNDDAAAVVAASVEIGLPLPIDYDHATEHAKASGAKAPAAGWITRLFARDGAVWGTVEWTAAAARHLAEREFRFLSPTFEFDKATRAVKRVLRAALTNDPALTMRAIAQAEGATMPMPTEEEMGALRALLALPEDADMAAVMSAIRKLAEGATAPAAALGKVALALGLKADAEASAVETAAATATARAGAAGNLASVRTELDALKGERALEKATAAVDAATVAGKITPAQRDWAIARATADLADFERFAAAAPAIVAPGRALTSAAPPAPAGPRDGVEKAVASAFRLDDKAWQASAAQMARHHEEARV